MKCISNPKEIGRVEDFLKRINRTAQLDDGTFYRLFVSTTEAVNNGIIHGNKSDPKKKVCISCTLNSDTITVKVKDEGRGFDPGSVPNPLEDQNLLKESGRGIFLIRSMMDKVNFEITKEGTIIEMIIDLRRLK
jgi:serine/threonine-protein kinase RsbW